MNKVYVTRSSHGRAIAFAVVNGKIEILYPDNFPDEGYLDILGGFRSKNYPDNAVNDGSTLDEILDAVCLKLGQAYPIDRDNVKISNMEPGRYFPRIWRGLYDPGSAYVFNSVDNNQTYGIPHVNSKVAVSSIFNSLELLFLYIEPSATNMRAFGHKVRELLIISCTEVESAWRSILEANSTSRKHSYTTSDYYRLAEPLRLKDWSVSLSNYPSLGEFSPFSSWDQSSPTKSLSWYSAYNAAKHHREAKFEEASLGNLINSAAALHVMQAAQWGPEIYDVFFGSQKSPFHVVSCPQHDLSDIYLPDFIGKRALSHKLFFG